MTEDTKIILDRLDKMDAKITDIQLTLENETNRNIRIIAEGHLDLSRKLDEAILTKDERELIFLRLSVLENDVRILKEQRA